MFTLCRAVLRWCDRSQEVYSRRPERMSDGMERPGAGSGGIGTATVNGAATGDRESADGERRLSRRRHCDDGAVTGRGRLLPVRSGVGGVERVS